MYAVVLDPQVLLNGRNLSVNWLPNAPKMTCFSKESLSNVPMELNFNHDLYFQQIHDSIREGEGGR